MRARQRAVARPTVPLLALAVLLSTAGSLLTATLTAPAARAATSTFTPTDDTYVGSDKPKSVNGKATTLQVDGSPVKTTLLKFTVSGLTGPVQQVVLRLRCVSDPSVAGGSVRPVASTAWSESTVTYATAPAVGTTVLGTLGAVAVNTWYTVDVTSAVTGNGTFALAVTSTNADGAAYASKESGAANAAQLVVTAGTTPPDTQAPSVPTGLASTITATGAVALTWAASTDTVGVTGYGVYRGGVLQTTVTTPAWTDATVTPATAYSYTVDAVDAAGNRSAQSAPLAVTTPPSGTGQAALTVTPTKDTYVEQDTATTNYGTAKAFSVDDSPVKTGLLAFDVAGLTGPVLSAKLRLWCASDPSVAGGSVRRLADTSWSETAVTWTTAPTPDTAVLASLGTVATGRWYEFDVTAAVTGNGTYGFAITSTNADGANYATRESGAATAPQLVILTPSSVADVTPPTVAVTSPYAGASANGSGVTLTADATDDVAVASVSFAVDGVPVGTPDTVTPYLLDWDSRTVANGPHTITATARDAAGNTTTSGAVSTTVANPTSPPCGALAASAPPARYAHVVWIWLENRNYADVLGPTAATTPFQKSVAAACASTSGYLDNLVPTLLSLPNYLVATSGSNCVTGLESTGTGCIVDDAGPTSHTLPTTSIFEQVAASGGTWKAYQEDMPKPCATSGSGLYAPRHNPPPYYANLLAVPLGGTVSPCATQDIGFPGIACTATGCPVPATGSLLADVTAGTLPTFAFVSPNLCNDAHDCTAAVGDRWLETWLPRIVAGPNYTAGDTLVVVVYDEGATGGSPIPDLFLSPWTPPTASTVTANHVALLRTTQDVLGLDHLGCATGVQPGTTTPCPTGWDADLRTALHF